MSKRLKREGDFEIGKFILFISLFQFNWLPIYNIKIVFIIGARVAPSSYITLKIVSLHFSLQRE